MPLTKEEFLRFVMADLKLQDRDKGLELSGKRNFTYLLYVFASPARAERFSAMLAGKVRTIDTRPKVPADTVVVRTAGRQSAERVIFYGHQGRARPTPEYWTHVAVEATRGSAYISYTPLERPPLPPGPRFLHSAKPD